MSEERIVKTEPAEPLQRLASIKAPRDLTLGGAKPAKKSFVPNLNVTRNKKKGPSTSREPNTEENTRRDRPERNRNANKNAPKVIKSGGVFSEGVGAVERHSSRASYGGGGGGRGETASAAAAAAVLQKPIFNINKQIKTEVKNERKADEVFWHKWFGDPHFMENVAMKQNSVRVNEKEEPVELTPEYVFDPQEKIADVLNTDQPTLLMIKLPSSLPGRGGRAEEQRPRRVLSAEPSTSKAQPGDSAATDDDDADEQPREQCRLTDLQEGKLGKLRVHSSGKVTLALGEIIFDVSMGLKPSSLMEAVSVAVDEGSRSANMISLGRVANNITVQPIWGPLLKAHKETS